MENPDTYVQRLAQWWHSVMERLKKRSWLLGVLVSFGILSLVLVVEHRWAVLLLDDVLKPLGHWFAGGASLPIGLSGLVFLIVVAGYIALLVGAAWIETSPVVKEWRERRSAEATSGPVITRSLSIEERNEIDKMRVLWNLYFGIAAQTCSQIFRGLIALLENKNAYWFELVKPTSRRLDAAAQAFGNAVADESPASLQDIHKCHDEAFAAYMGACHWIALIAERENIDLADGSSGYLLPRWRDQNVAFRVKLSELVQSPTHKHLKSEVNWQESAVTRLLYPQHALPTPTPPAS